MYHKLTADGGTYDIVVLYDDDRGHEDENLECWCEPEYYWLKNKQSGSWTFVIEHTNEGEVTRNETLIERDKEPDWITQVLEKVGSKTC